MKITGIRRGAVAAAAVAALMALAACGGGDDLDTVPAETPAGEVAPAETEAAPTEAAPTEAAPTEAAPTEAAPADTGTTEEMTGTDEMTGATGTEDAPTATSTVGRGIAGAEGVLVTASSLIDYTFNNQADETVGDVSDIIVDTRSGRIPYLIIEYGGLLDLGETQLPMPLNAFSWRGASDIVINFDEAALEQFPELDDEWYATTDWDMGVQGFWGALGFGDSFGHEGAVDPTLPENTEVSPAAGDVPVDDATDSEPSGSTGVSDTVGSSVAVTASETATLETATGEATTGETATGEASAPAYIRVSDLLGRPVIDNGMGEGMVEELLLDLARGRVKYVLVNYAETVSDDEIFAIPFEAFDFAATEDGLAFGSSFSPEFLTTAPRLERSFLGDPADTDPAMEPSIQEFWTEQGYFGDWE